jgi:tRNA (guanine-N7-)-methyltransferase
MAALLPRLRVSLEGPGKLQPLALFPDTISKVWLEIGFGGGEHLASLAARNPHTGFIGNIRIFDGDGRLLLEDLEDATIDRLFILYPDPWPKRRHEKRRLLDTGTIAEIYRVMKSGGELRLATDSADYAGWSLRNIMAHGGFDWLAEGSRDWRQPPQDWYQTRYEAKALGAGRRPIYLRFLRGA